MSLRQKASLEALTGLDYPFEPASRFGTVGPRGDRRTFSENDCLVERPLMDGRTGAYRSSDVAQERLQNSHQAGVAQSVEQLIRNQ